MLILIILIYVPVRIIYDDHAIDVIENTHYVKDLHPDLDGLKIISISDIQADYYTNKERLLEYVNKVNSLNPDIILITGDMITHTPDYIDLSGEIVGKFKSKYGVYHITWRP